MNSFLNVQARDPFDPAPMLILADDREEAGDIVEASALRALVAAGYPSLVWMALQFDNIARDDGLHGPSLRNPPWEEDVPAGFGTGIGDSRNSIRDGQGAGLDDGFGSHRGIGMGEGC